MLSLQNIKLTLGANTPLERKLFQDFNLDINQGEFVVIVGGNGAGKSTLMNIISGYLPVDEGQILIDKKDVTLRKHHERSSLIAHVMQDPKVGTMENMTLEENLSFALLRGQKRKLGLHNTKARAALFKTALAPLGMNLEDRLNDYVGSLSGGQRQGLALVMAMLTSSRILLLDEITAALDPKASETVMKLAAQFIAQDNLTSIMITHNLQHALSYGSRLIVLKDGAILRQISAEEKASLTLNDLRQLCQ